MQSAFLLRSNWIFPSLWQTYFLISHIFNRRELFILGLLILHFYVVGMHQDDSKTWTQAIFLYQVPLYHSSTIMYKLINYIFSSRHLKAHPSSTPQQVINSYSTIENS